MEELLERQWEQGSNFLMEQGQHFDSKSQANYLGMSGHLSSYLAQFMLGYKMSAFKFHLERF